MDFHDLYDGEFLEWQAYLEQCASAREWIHVPLKGSEITILPIGVEIGAIGPISNVPMLVFVLACNNDSADLAAIPINGFDAASARKVEKAPHLDYSQLLSADAVASVIRRLGAQGVVRHDD